MRLLDTQSLMLRPPSARPPRYAILSHTWGADEASLQIAQAINAGQVLQKGSAGLEGWRKVIKASAVAQHQGYGYIWVDTCCIDKTNLTELSEAINSMFKWYAEAEICYAYLADVPDDEQVSHRHSSFRASRWFTRGWTLQELIAPREVHFYSKDWKFLGSRTDLKDLVFSITGIPVDVLTTGDCRPPARSIGEIFSWAARRYTTLEEDLAYSLLGLLNINMPLIYGEGSVAFMRVQEEVLRTYDDESIFAWEAPPDEAIMQPLSGLLSPSLTYFRASHRFLKPRIWTKFDQEPTAMTNLGVSIHLSLIPGDEKTGQRLALLNCQIVGTDVREVQPAIRVQKLAGRQYARVDVHHIHHLPISPHVFQAKLPETCSMIFPRNPQTPLPVTAFMYDLRPGGICTSPDAQQPVSFKVVRSLPASSWIKTWPDKLLLDCTSQFASARRPGHRAPKGERSRDTSPWLTGGLEIEVHQNSDLLGSAYILCGLEQVDFKPLSQLNRVLPWCCILPAGTRSHALEEDPLEVLPKQPRSEWPADLTLVLREGMRLFVVVDIVETQGPGRVVYEISLRNSCVKWLNEG